MGEGYLTPRQGVIPVPAGGYPSPAVTGYIPPGRISHGYDILPVMHFHGGFSSK